MPVYELELGDPEDAVRVALKSGINMSMSDEYYSKYLPGLIKSGKVTMAELDDAARYAGAAAFPRYKG